MHTCTTIDKLIQAPYHQFYMYRIVSRIQGLHVTMCTTHNDTYNTLYMYVYWFTLMNNQSHDSSWRSCDRLALLLNAFTNVFNICNKWKDMIDYCTCRFSSSFLISFFQFVCLFTLVVWFSLNYKSVYWCLCPCVHTFVHAYHCTVCASADL